MTRLSPFVALAVIAIGFISACDGTGTTPDPTSAWEKQPNPVHTGAFGVASDPSVMRTSDGYRMCYTCLDVVTDRTAICGASSSDGISWQDSPPDGSPPGLLLGGLAGTAEASVEGCELVQRGAVTFLYYSGYPEVGTPVPGFPATLYLATSSGGSPFEREGPVLAPTPGGFDSDAVYSPSILDIGGTLQMVYTGHCYSGCAGPPGVVLLGATSSDGRTWTKRESPLLRPNAAIPWTANGVAESALFEDGSGGYALLVTGGLGDNEKQRVGLARASSVGGPWALSSDPVLTPTAGRFDAAGLLAPSVIVEDGLVRTWFFGLSDAGRYSIGYAQAPYPLEPHTGKTADS